MQGQGTTCDLLVITGSLKGKVKLGLRVKTNRLQCALRVWYFLLFW